jgi:hypothetical protein
LVFSGVGVVVADNESFKINGVYLALPVVSVGRKQRKLVKERMMINGDKKR